MRPALALVCCACAALGCRPVASDHMPTGLAEPLARLLPFIETAAGGRIDWGNLRALSDGAARGDEAAKSLAFALSDASADARDSVGSILAGGATLHRMAQTSSVRTTVGPSAVELPLTGEGGLIDLIHPTATRRADAPVERADASAVTWPEVAAAAPSFSNESESESISRWAFGTGPQPLILIDARGLGARPAIFPSVRDEWGGMVYSVLTPARETVVERGLARYVTLAGGLDPRHLRLKDVDGESVEVAIAQASAVDGPRRAELVLSGEEARRIAALTDSLRTARVMVLLDAPAE